MRNFNRLYLGLLLFAFLISISTTSHALERSLDQGLDEIAQKVTKSIPAGAKKTVAVMDFNSIEGGVTVFGRFIGEELITKLFESERFKVIERSLLEKALEELKFNTSDVVDPSVAKQLGKVVGADAIVTGTLSDLGQSVKINARVIMVESGEVIGAAGAQVIKDASVVNMMKKAISRSSRKTATVEADSDSTEENYTDDQIKAIKGTWDVFTLATSCVSCSVGQRFHAVLVIDLKDNNSFLGRISFDGIPSSSVEGGKIIGKEIKFTRVDRSGYIGWFKGDFEDNLLAARGTFTDSPGNEGTWTANKR